MFFSGPQALTRINPVDFQPGPFSPQINSRCCLQNIGDVSTANARRNFQEIELIINFAPDEFAVRRARGHYQGPAQTPVDVHALNLLARSLINPSPYLSPTSTLTHH